MSLAVSLNGDLVPIPPSSGGGGATIANTTNLISGDGAGNGVDSEVLTDGSGHIKGADAGGGTLNLDGKVGTAGSINLSGPAGSDTGRAGNIDLGGSTAQSGDITTRGGSSLGKTGGNIATYGGNTGAGGNIDTHGGNNDGGNIITYDGGGTIDTTGRGTLEFGFAATRTTITGTATTPRSIAFPDASGEISLGVSIALDTGWTANADAGDKTAVIPSTADLTTCAAALDLLVAGAGSALLAIGQKVKAMEISLSTSKLPNA